MIHDTIFEKLGAPDIAIFVGLCVLLSLRLPEPSVSACTLSEARRKADGRLSDLHSHYSALQLVTPAPSARIFILPRDASSKMPLLATAAQLKLNLSGFRGGV